MSGSSLPGIPKKTKKRPEIRKFNSEIRRFQPENEEEDQEDYGDEKIVSSSGSNMSVDQESSSSGEDSLDEDMKDILGEFC